MKNSLSLLLLLGLALTASAGTVTLRFDPSPTPGVTNYVLIGTQGTNTTRVNLGLSLTNQVNYTNAATFTVRAQKDGLESEPSNALAVELIQPAGNFTVVIEQAADLAGTNWTPVGFFRLKLGP